MNRELLYQNKKIFYRVMGKGNPIMLIHGFGEDGNVWNIQVDFLKTQFQLIVPDLPGSGKSEMIEDMSIEGMAEVIKEIIDKESSKAGFGGVVIGHSMGGYITLAFAEKYPPYLKAFGLFHSTAYADNEEKRMARRKGIEFINQHGAFEFLKTSASNLFSPNSKKQSGFSSGQGSIEEFINGLKKFSPASLVSYYEAMIRRPDRTDILKKTTVPVLFIMGEYDNAAPLQDCLQQCHLPEKSYIHILYQSAHMGMLEEAEKSNNILKLFLADV
jgi:pimeloyl-ACP methyl ester carboxylesterase